MNVQSISSGVFMMASLLLATDGELLMQFFKPLALVIAGFHLFELAWFNMDKPHKMHHWMVIVTELFAICFYTTGIEYLLGVVNSIPLGSNMLSHARKSNRTYDIPYFCCYVILKVSIFICNYHLLFVLIDGITVYGKVGTLFLCGIHATQAYFTFVIVRVLLRKERHLLLVTCLLLSSGLAWCLIQATSKTILHQSGNGLIRR